MNQAAAQPSCLPAERWVEREGEHPNRVEQTIDGVIQHVAPTADSPRARATAPSSPSRSMARGPSRRLRRQHQGALLIVGGRGHEVGSTHAHREGGPCQGINGNAVEPTDERGSARSHQLRSCSKAMLPSRKTPHERIGESGLQSLKTGGAQSRPTNR